MGAVEKPADAEEMYRRIDYALVSGATEEEVGAKCERMRRDVRGGWNLLGPLYREGRLVRQVLVRWTP